MALSSVLGIGNALRLRNFVPPLLGSESRYRRLGSLVFSPGKELAMNIGEASKASGVSAKMIRYYESIGLIEAPGRSDAGYRVYSQSEIAILRFIRRARDLNFPVERIRELLALWIDRGRASADVKRLALEHVEGLEKRMHELGEMASTLRHLAEHCQGDDRPDCPIIGSLSHETVAEPLRPGKRRATRFSRA